MVDMFPSTLKKVDSLNLVANIVVKLTIFSITLGPKQTYLVGGFNPFEKYARQIGSFPQEGVKKYLLNSCQLVEHFSPDSKGQCQRKNRHVRHR